MLLQLLLVFEVLVALDITAVKLRVIIDSHGPRVETATYSTKIGAFVVALIAKVMGAGEGDDADVYGVAADGTHFGLFLDSLRVELYKGM